MRIVNTSLVNARHASLRDARDPVVFFYNGLGDHLLALPAIRALAALFPKRLRIICIPLANATFFSDVAVRSFLDVEIRIIDGRRVFSADGLAKRIKACDLFISLAPWHSSSVEMLLQLTRPNYAIGFSQHFHEVLPNDSYRHSADVAFNAPRRIDCGLRIEDFSAPPRLSSENARRAIKLRRSLAGNRPLVIIHTDTIQEKMWPAEKWSAFLEIILNRYKTLVVFVVGSSHATADAICRKSRTFPLTGLPLSTSLALISIADWFIGVDSCMLHAADLFRIPAVGLFGPTNAEKWGFRFTKGHHVQGDLTMDSIGVDRVVLAFERLLSCSSSTLVCPQLDAGKPGRGLSTEASRFWPPTGADIMVDSSHFRT